MVGYTAHSAAFPTSSGGADPTLPAGLEVGGLALLLERPLRKTSLISTVRMVLRARRRQYEVRDHLNEQVRIGLELAQAARSKDEFSRCLRMNCAIPWLPSVMRARCCSG